MYLKKVLLLNSGALADLEVVPEFTADGKPKPLVIVGSNGCGKTNLLSTIADALVEFQARHFTDVMPLVGGARAFYRLVGGATIRMGSTFEVCAAKFDHSDGTYLYRSKAGTVHPDTLAARMAEFAPLSSWSEKGNAKDVAGPWDNIESIFRDGAYAFFPSNRFEQPYWLNVDQSAIEQEMRFAPRIVNKLEKPLIVNAGVRETRPWLADVILDQAVDAAVAFSSDAAHAKQQAISAISNVLALANVNAVLQSVLDEPGAGLRRAPRGARNRRLLVAAQSRIVLPSFDALSAGQASVFSIFATVLRYGDTGVTAKQTSEIEGIVLVDEIDAHLHADMQHVVLPALIRLFPRVQFIITSHSPLFALGMAKAFGAEGFTLLELPSGLRIGPERFSEFDKSFTYFRETQAFEAALATRVSATTKPLILSEGETDPAYLKTAAELLGFTALAAGSNFDWIGQRIGGSVVGSGKSGLNDAYRVLKFNPSLLSVPTVLIYDADANKPDEAHGRLLVRGLPANPENQLCRAGVENLLPEAVFEDRFYDVTEKRTADVTTIRKLKKVELCNHLCENVRDVAHFEKFRPFLVALSAALSLT